MHNPLALLRTAFWLLLGFIALMGLKPSPPEQLFDAADKLYHALAFAFLTLMGGLAYPAMSWRRIAAVVIGVGVLIEWGQMLSPTRTASVADLLANLCGFLIGAGLLWLIRRSTSGLPGAVSRSAQNRE